MYHPGSVLDSLYVIASFNFSPAVSTQKEVNVGIYPSVLKQRDPLQESTVASLTIPHALITPPPTNPRRKTKPSSITILTVSLKRILKLSFKPRSLETTTVDTGCETCSHLNPGPHRRPSPNITHTHLISPGSVHWMLPKSNSNSRNTRAKPSKDINWLFFDSTHNTKSKVQFMTIDGYSQDAAVGKLPWVYDLKRLFKFRAGIIEFWQVANPPTTPLSPCLILFPSRKNPYRWNM